MPITRRGGLRRALAVAAGLAGAAGAGRAGTASAAAGAGHLRLVLDARGLRSHAGSARAVDPPARGDALTTRAELFDAADGGRVGELYGAGLALHGPGLEAPAAERLELYSFELTDGTIVAGGTAGQTGGLLAVLGGSGRYQGARGTCRDRRDGAGGGAELTLDLLL